MGTAEHVDYVGSSIVPGNGRPFELRRSRGLSWQAAKYGAILRTRLTSNMAYFGEAMLRTIFLGIVLFIFTQLWRTTYAGMGAHRVAGWTMAQMIWYLTLTESITMSRPTVMSDIDEEVRSGGLAYVLGRPCHYLLTHLANHLGDRLLRLVVNFGIGATLALVLVGPIAVTLLGACLCAVAVGLAVLIDFVGVLSVGLLAFWLEDTSSIALLYSRITMLLGGVLIPPTVFPPVLARLCRDLPFTSLYYVPGHLLVGAAGGDAALLLVKQLGWLAVGAGIALSIFRKGVARVESNGG